MDAAERGLEMTGYLSNEKIHVAFVTDDIHGAIDALVNLLGIPRPVIKETPPLDIAQPQYLGESSNLGCLQSNFQWGPIGLEVIQPNDEPSVWRDFLDTRGPGIHHIGMVEEQPEEARRHLLDSGLDSVQEGCFNGGGYEYFDGRELLGAFIEILSFKKDDERSAPTQT